MNLWTKISSTGINRTNGLSSKETVRLIFFNQLLFFGVFATSFQVLLSWPFIGLKSLIFVAIPICSLISLYLNSIGKTLLSRVLFVYVVYLVGSLTTVYLGGSGYYHLNALAIFLSTLILFDLKKELIYVVLGVPILALSISIGEFDLFNSPDFSNHELIHYYRLANVLTLLIIGSVLIIFILNLNRKSEARLEELVLERTEELLAKHNDLEKENKEKEILLKEVHHRVKNNLQIIVSLINLQLSKIDNTKITEPLLVTQSRVLSMSLVHQKMYQTSNFSEIVMKKYTSNLIENVQSLYSESSLEPELNIDPEFTLNTDNAIPVGLIINEIVTNFYKHAYANENSNFKISILRTGDKLFTFTYSDNGPGFKDGVDPDDPNSLGLQLIDTLVSQIDGAFKFHTTNGAHYEFTIPVE